MTGSQLIGRTLGWMVVCFISYAPVKAIAGDHLGQAERLQRGEIVLETPAMSGSAVTARVTALFHADAEVVWHVIGYCDYEFIYLKGLKLCEVVEPGLYHTVIHQKIKNSWFAPTLDFTLEANRTSQNNGDFKLVDGDLKRMEGYWKFVPLAESNDLIVIHEITIQPKFPAPQWLVRHSLKKDLPNMLACMRGLAHASGNDQQMLSDLGRCPGELPENDTHPAIK